MTTIQKPICVKTQSFRRSLGRFIGDDVTLICDNIELRVNEEGTYLLLLKDAVISRVGNTRKNRDSIYNHVEHIWIKINEKTMQELKRAKKVSVHGKVYTYTYKDKEQLNVGVKAQYIRVIQPKHRKRKDNEVRYVEFFSYAKA